MIDTIAIFDVVQLCRLLGADVLDTETVYFQLPDRWSGGGDSLPWGELQRRSGPNFVSYDRFLTSYWPRFPQHALKNLGMAAGSVARYELTVAGQTHR